MPEANLLLKDPTLRTYGSSARFFNPWLWGNSRDAKFARITKSFGQPFRESKQFCEFGPRPNRVYDVKLAIFFPIGERPPSGRRKHES